MSEHSSIDIGPDTNEEYYVAISPNGSIVATFNQNDSFISIRKIETNDEARKIPIQFDKPTNILGWSLAVSDVINDICLVAISCVTDKDMNPKEIEKDVFRRKFRNFISIRRLLLWVYRYFSVMLFILYAAFASSSISILSYAYYIIIAIVIFYLYEKFVNTRNPLKGDNKIFKLSCSSSDGIINLFKISFNDDRDNDNYIIHSIGGVVTFLKNFKNSSNNNATIICMNSVKIKKFNIKLDKNITAVSKESTYLLPENLFEKLESFKDSKCKWNYLLKSNFQKYLMVDTSKNDYVQSIEIYDINNLKLVNVFHRNLGEDFLISDDNEPGIFAISTDSRLFAYSHKDNIITLYLMESGLEVVSKKFDNIYKIRLLKFIEKDKSLFIIEEDKKNDWKFHIWLISGCLNDIQECLLDILDSNDSILSKYNGQHYNISKVNEKVVFYNKNQNQRSEHEITIKRVTFGKNDCMADAHEYESSGLEPWNNNARTLRGKFLNDDDKKFLLIIGQNSIQLWKSKSENFVDYNDFKNFENSNLVYILINDKIKQTGFQIEDDMVTVIIHACKSLVHLYNNNNINNKKCQKFISGITNIIKDFIKRYPDNWKLMEVQYPLMAYLIYSRSFSLIKYILFDANSQITGKLHKPRENYFSPYYKELKNENSDPANDLENSDPDNDLESKAANDLELALNFCQKRNAVMLGYLLEYYSENSMTHIGWMINVTKILPYLSGISDHDYYGNYMDLLLYKPCFGEMKYNFPIKRFKMVSASQNTLKVYVPLTNLLSANSSPSLYKKIRKDMEPDVCMVPLINFTTYNNLKTKNKSKKIYTYFLYFWGLLLPPFYKELKDKKFDLFLQFKKNETIFLIPAIEAAINSRWYQAMAYWMKPLSLYAIFLIIYSILHDLTPITDTFQNIGIAMFYYIGAYLLIIEIMQIRKHYLDNLRHIVPSGHHQDNPFDNIWNSIFSMYYLSTNNLNDYSDDWVFKSYTLVANIFLVFVLTNMIIAVMNDGFKKAKNDGNIGLLKYRTELIDDFEKLDIPFNNPSQDSPYICYLQDPKLMKNWMEKSKELREKKLYSWFRENVDKENITYDGVDITSWYELISSNEN
ncbi:hypothetical protein RclHR1_06920004 [Rhizophagus clarus]|uniref:Ion transport domain-containing protein n=1 Tax=Rhizophagus clarus TaxID=94130 RepID=A0A2Z6S6V1_9GLOM|nr:hypothetical protein RclHR1_06920004 [Rhizophagus clarus]